jgi:hypothetical protein
MKKSQKSKPSMAGPRKGCRRLVGWKAEDRTISRARWALQLQRLDLSTTDEPFAAIILCTSDPAKVDKRTRSNGRACSGMRWSTSELVSPLAALIRRKGGINKCAARFARCLGRRGRN